MIIFKSAIELSAFLHAQKAQDRQIGFVPTMGALHDGHLSLIRAANNENDLTVCSIFINPTQFNNPSDFAHYPVTIERDIEHLVQSACSVLFLPSATEVYGQGYVAPQYALGNIESLLEGKYRPGHFQGVCQVVDRLLRFVHCDHLYLGQKDYQQCMVVRRLLQITGRTDTVRLQIVPTVREAGGLAMSSRNMRLSEPDKTRAQALSGILQQIQQRFHTDSLRHLEAEAIEHLSRKGFVVDYVSIAHTDTLQPAHSPSGSLVCLVAASIGEVRLIDNMLLN